MNPLLPPSTIKPENYRLEQIMYLLQNAINIATYLAGGVAMIFLIWGSFQYFTAFGSDEKATKAKNTVLWALIGVFVVLIARLILAEVWNTVSGTHQTWPVTPTQP